MCEKKFERGNTEYVNHCESVLIVAVKKSNPNKVQLEFSHKGKL